MSSEPTLPASPTKRLTAKREGNVARSGQLISAAILLGSTILLQSQFEFIEQQLSQNWQRQFQLESPLDKTTAQWGTVSFWLQQSLPILQLFGPIILGIIAVAILSNLLQTGLIFTPKRLVPDVTRLNPANWWNRVSAAEHQVETIGSLLRSISLFTLTACSLWFMREKIAALSLLPARQIPYATASILSQILLQLGIALFILGVLDYTWQKLKWERSLRMTPEELRKEQKAQAPNTHRSTPKARKADRDSRDLTQAAVVLYAPDGPIVAIAYNQESMDVPRIQQIWDSRTNMTKSSEGVLRMAREQRIHCQMHIRLTTLIANTMRPRQLIPPHMYREVINILRQA